MKTAVLLGLFSTVMALPSPSPQAAAAPAAADPNSCAAVSKAFVQQKAANPQSEFLGELSYLLHETDRLPKHPQEYQHQQLSHAFSPFPTSQDPP